MRELFGGVAAVALYVLIGSILMAPVILLSRSHHNGFALLLLAVYVAGGIWRHESRKT